MGIFDKFKEKLSGFFATSPENVTVEKVKSGLSKTRTNIFEKIKKAIGFGRKIDDNLLYEIEEILITSDIGVEATDQIIQSLQRAAKSKDIFSSEDVFELLKLEIISLLEKSAQSINSNPFQIDENNKPHTILVVGVNGVGKTTTIGKLAYNFKKLNKTVLIGAADTFRAAANEQLEIWAERAGVPLIQQRQGADPAAVAYDTLHSAISRKIDIVILDTAGRLHNKANLMAELAKIDRVLKKLKPNAPDEVLLVLDATTGQNAIQQAREFTKVTPITGLVLTKLDGTAKGGVIIPIAMEFKIPVKFIGVGEKIDDLQPFNPVLFVEALFEN
ncbi:MAG: signal recognition particle-docking protein FtsY [Ignavibacteria bacterium]|nr:signal recognition particle-docking protein FtsY [Ignavibacteria bacterium]